MATKSILLVDDDEAHLLWSEEILSEQGYRIRSTHSAKEALDFFDSESFDLVISDLVMPEMSGIDFMRRVAQKKHGQKAIILTGHGDIDTFIESVYDVGALEYIVKPVDAEEFVAMVAKLTSPDTDLAANS
ncbi:MAG: response regulator [Nitrospinae bacterium]|nr:response regulator [Nitrospinota bacterium]